MRTIVNFFIACVGICIILPSYADTLNVSAIEPQTPAYLTQSRNSITGFVFSESRTPVPRVWVELQNDVYSTVARVQTNGSGLFTFNGLPTGQYNIKVVTAGTDFHEQTRSVTLMPVSFVSGRGGVSEQVDFYLKRRKAEESPSGAPTVVFVQEVPEKAKELYESGVTDLESKNEAAGLDKLRKSLEAFPEYFLALERLGTEYVNRGHYQPAFVLLTKAVDINPRSFSSTLGLGIAEFRLGRADRAAELFEKSTELVKNSANAHLWLGIALHSRNSYEKALAAMLRANELSNGTSPEVHFQLARVYKDQSQFKKAADEMELYLKYSPDAPNAAEIRKIIEVLRKKQ